MPRVIEYRATYTGPKDVECSAFVSIELWEDPAEYEIIGVSTVFDADIADLEQQAHDYMASTFPTYARI